MVGKLVKLLNSCKKCHICLDLKSGGKGQYFFWRATVAKFI